MNTEDTIQQAFTDMELAEQMIGEGLKIYFKAKKQLESVYSPAGPKGKKIKNKAIIENTVTDMNKRLFQKRT